MVLWKRLPVRWLAGRYNYRSKSWGSKVYVLHDLQSSAQTEFDVNVIARSWLSAQKIKLLWVTRVSCYGLQVNPSDWATSITDERKEKNVLFMIETHCISYWIIDCGIFSICCVNVSGKSSVTVQKPNDFCRKKYNCFI